MVHRNDAMWRIEFLTDQTRADALALPLAYVLEAHWKNGVRWLGMLFRKRLMPLELARVNLATWPELRDLEDYMKRLFDEAWTSADQAVGPGELRGLGSSVLAAKYPVQSALRFSPAPHEFAFSDDEPVNSFSELYTYLLNQRDELNPVLAAPVVRLPARKPQMIRHQQDLELANRAA